MGAVDSSRVREVLNYEPETGLFTWRVSNSNRRLAGSAAGRVAKGYVGICIDGRLYQAHRLAWLYVHGEWPPSALDHVNGVPNDNRISNLRLADASQNGLNRGAQSNNKSGFKGVSWSRVAKKWMAEIVVRGRHYHLGYHDDPARAAAAYREAVDRLTDGFGRAA